VQYQERKKWDIVVVSRSTAIGKKKENSYGKMPFMFR
jgi:hypothetical protein